MEVKTVNEEYIKPITRFKFDVNKIKVGCAIKITNIKPGDDGSSVIMIVNGTSAISVGENLVCDAIKTIDQDGKIYKFKADDFGGDHPNYKLEVLS